MIFIENVVTRINRQTPFVLEDWIVEPEFNQLTRGDATHRVEPKVMSVLLRLASQAQHVVSKDEILRAVWPDTFVTEDALTRCISVLRHILEDDLRHPRFIKTVPRVGYCLLIAARTLEILPADLPSPESLKLPEKRERLYPPVLPIETAASAPPVGQTTGKRMTRIPIGTAAFAVALAIGIVLLVVHANRAKSTPPTIRIFQLTTDAGEQSRPAFSPDGRRLAFVWAKDDGSPQHIYTKELGSETPLRLTDLPDSEYSPAWSPDGKQIAFLSSSDTGLGLYISSLSTPPSVRKVYIPGEIKRWEEGALSWSPDGKSFVLVDHIGAQASSSIYLIDVETLRARALTTPPPGWEGDIDPVFSSDGTKIAFLRVTEGWNGDLYWVPTAGGEPHPITHDGKKVNGIAWSSDNQSIVFSSDRAGQDALWRASLKGGAPERMPVGSEDAIEPAIPLNGNNLAFVQGSAVFGILRISASTNASRETKGSLIVSSTAQDSAPSISPDGKQFAFQSWRSRSRQIWVSSIDGNTLRQLTHLDGVISGSGSPSWAPDGGQILFDARIYGHAHIFVIPVASGTPKQLTFGDVNDIVPRWSANGHSIYFRSNRSGRWQLWKLPALGGTPQAVTSEDGIVGQESPDGKWLYCARGDENNGIWRMPVSGGEAIRILDQPTAGYWGYWGVTANGIYFLDQRQSTPSISVYDPVTQKTTCIAKLNRLPPLFSGLTVLHGGRELLISDKYDAGSHISIAQGVF